MKLTFDEFCQTYTPTETKSRPTIAFSDWLRNRGESLPSDWMTLEVEALLGSLELGLTRTQRGKINSKKKLAARIRQLHSQYIQEVQWIEETREVTGERANLLCRVMYKRHLRSQG
jgi:hypothetical protein